MLEIKRFLSMSDVFKNALVKMIPELEGIKFEVEWKTGLICSNCGPESHKKTGALFYRIAGTEDWIQVDKTFKCPNCRNGEAEALNQFMSSSLEEQKNQIVARLTKEYFHLPENLKDAGFKNYQETNKVTSDARKKAIDYTKEFIATEENRYNLLILGNPGTGKSHLSAAIARTMREKGFTVGFLTTGKLLSMIKSTYKKGAEKSEEEIFQDLKKLDLLILDDLGSESIGGNDDWRKGTLFEIVESRSGKPTIYTSNLTDKDLPAAVGKRVFSRLYDNTKFIDVFTDDYRKRKQIV